MVVIGIAYPFSQRGILGYINHTLNFLLDRREGEITGAQGERVLISTLGLWKSSWLLLYGLGPEQDLSLEVIAGELEALREDLKRLDLTRVAYLLPGYDPYKIGDPFEAACLLTEIMPPGIVCHADRKVLQGIERAFHRTPPMPEETPKQEEIPSPPVPEVAPPQPRPVPMREYRRARASLLWPWRGIIDGYVLREILSPFILGIGIFVLLLFIGRITDLLVFLRGGSLTLLLSIVASLTVASISLVLPPAFLFGSVVAISRFSSDAELIAAQALGISLRRIAQPILILAFWVTAVALFFSLYVGPLANQAFYGSVMRMAYSSKGLGLQEGRFIKLSSHLWLYSSHLHETHLRDLLLYENGDGGIRVLSAVKGRLKVDPETHSFILILKDGEILTVGGRRYNLLNFDKYRFLLPALGPSFKGFSKKELTLPQLLRRVQREKQRGPEHYWDVLNHLYKRFSLPFSTVVFALLALALGPFLPRAERWTGLLFTFGLFLLYYVLLSISQNMAMKGLISSFLGAWLPDIILGAGGGAILYMRSEKVGL